MRRKRLELKEYDEAYELFQALARRGYSDSAVRMKDVVYAYAQDEMSQGEYQTALDTLFVLDRLSCGGRSHSGSVAISWRCRRKRTGNMRKPTLSTPIWVNTRDCADKAARFENGYAAAAALLAEGEYDNAKSAFEALKDYADAEKMAKESAYQKGEKQLADGQFDDAKATFESLEDYADAQTKAKESVYQKARSSL